MPAAKLSPTGPRITATPPVMYSQPLAPQPSTTAMAPELRTQKRSPAWPAANSLPAVAPYSTVLPMMVLRLVSSPLETGGLSTMMPPERPLPT